MSLRWSARSPAALAIALTITVGAEALLIVPTHVGATRGVALAIVAAAAWALVVSSPPLETHGRWVVVAAVIASAIAVAYPPRGSHDLWSYVMYGRTISAHHASPYVHAPSAFVHDPFLHRVGSGWRSTRSVYGPLFTGASALLTSVAGGSALRARLAFQALSLGSVLAAVAVLRREAPGVRTSAFLALHPAIVVAVVNGGHNDGFVGLAIIAGAALARRERSAAAGVALGLGILVKASAGLGAVGIAMWLWTRDRRQGYRFLLFAALTTVVGYAPAGTSALSVLAGSASRTSRASPWSPLERAVHEPLTGLATVVVGLLALAGARAYRARRSPALPAGAAVAAYLVSGAYVLPWYSAWALPTAAATSRSRLSRLVAAHAAFLVAAYELPRRVVPGAVASAVRGVALGCGATLFLVLFVALVGSASSARAVPVELGDDAVAEADLR